MDTLDIKQAPSFGEQDPFDLIWDLQKNLVQEYTKIEKLPKYPLNLDVKADQLLIKDFIGRVIEEMAEAEEHLLLINLEPKDVADYTGSDSPNINIDLYREELADATHFLMETLIFVFGDQKAFYNAYIKEVGDELFDEGPSVLESSEQFVRYYKYSEHPPYSYTLFRDTEYPSLAWAITRELKLAANGLRNKPWKQTEVRTNTQVVHQHLMRATILFFGGLQVWGLTSELIYQVYWSKNQINHFRIKSRY